MSNKISYLHYEHMSSRMTTTVYSQRVKIKEESDSLVLNWNGKSFHTSPFSQHQVDTRIRANRAKLFNSYNQLQ